MKKIALILILLTTSASAQEGPPQIFAPDGKYLGDMDGNKYNPNSIYNPVGKYGNPYGRDNVANPYGRYGSEYSPQSPNFEYGRGNRHGK